MILNVGASSSVSISETSSSNSVFTLAVRHGTVQYGMFKYHSELEHTDLLIQLCWLCTAQYGKLNLSVSLVVAQEYR